jgi:hypothetical protein
MIVKIKIGERMKKFGKNLNRKDDKKNKTINVRFPSMMGDENRSMTIQELEDEYKDYLIIDPSVGEQVDIERLANLDIPEVVVMPPIAGG